MKTGVWLELWGQGPVQQSVGVLVEACQAAVVTWMKTNWGIQSKWSLRRGHPCLEFQEQLPLEFWKDEV